jgi:hypothetical protein
MYFSYTLVTVSYFFLKFLRLCIVVLGDRAGTVVKVLCYKSEGLSFDSRLYHWNISLA